MRIFVAHSSDFDFKSKLYEPLRASALNTKHEILLPQEEGKEVITREIIKNTDLLVAEASCPSTGQGIELDWADIFRVPIVCIFEKGAKISSSLHYVTDNFISYDDADDMLNKLEGVVENLEKENYK